MGVVGANEVGIVVVGDGEVGGTVVGRRVVGDGVVVGGRVGGSVAISMSMYSVTSSILFFNCSANCISISLPLVVNLTTELNVLLPISIKIGRAHV